ncbi:MAG TPA: carboxylesterase family protein [Flavobacteriales bacterium]|nr:carboxylesterase family protein [Flavobacteriales bacterium]
MSFQRRHLLSAAALLLAAIGAQAQSWLCDSPIMTDRNAVESYTVETVAFAYCARPDCDGMGDTLHMNVYTPQTMRGATAKPERFPLLVFFTGGGFWQGNFNIPQWPEAFVKRGFVVATPEYRLGWDRNSDGVIDSLDFSPDLVSAHCEGNALSLMRAVMRGYLDAHAAIRFMLGNPTEYPVDPDLVYVGGPSAGGSLSMTAAFTTWEQLEDYWNNFSGGQPYEVGPCDMRYSIRDCPLLGPDYTAPYKIRGVVNCWGQAIIDPNLGGDPGAIDLISIYASGDFVNPPDVGRILSCPDYPYGLGGRAMHHRLVDHGHCVKTMEDPDARHKTVFLTEVDTLYDDVVYPLSVQRGERARFIAAQASCLFKSSLCGTPCTDTTIYIVDDPADWLRAYYAVNGTSRGEPNGCEVDGTARFLPILPPGGFARNDLLVWPNPSPGGPMSVAWNKGTRFGDCIVTDPTGRIIFSGTIANRSTPFSSIGLDNGYYYVRVKDKDSTYTTRFMVFR